MTIPAPVRTLQIGALGPAFEGVPGADGRRHRLADVRGPSATVLIFTANRCPTAKAHAGRLEAARRRFEPLGVRFVLINSNDPHLHPEERLPRMAERAQADDLAVPYLSDADQVIARAYGPTCTFHAFVLDAKLRLRYEGRFDDARLEERVESRDVEAALDDILAGRRVAVPSTPAFGCSLEIMGDDRVVALPDLTADGSGTKLETGLTLVSAGAWAVSIVVGASGSGSLLGHDALIEGGALGPPPIWLAIPAFIVVWQLMLAAMMVPASTPALAVVGRASQTFAQPTVELAGFVLAFAIAWSVFGLAAFIGDMVVHRVVHATPWLAARPEVIQAGILALAGAYQLTPWKRRGLEACRDPHAVAACCAPASSQAGLTAGVRHALDCLAASWALMLVTFAAGFSNLAWMAVLTGVMAYETRGRHGLALSRVVGLGLLALAATILAIGGSPLGGSPLG